MQNASMRDCWPVFESRLFSYAEDHPGSYLCMAFDGNTGAIVAQKIIEDENALRAWMQERKYPYPYGRADGFIVYSGEILTKKELSLRQ